MTGLSALAAMLSDSRAGSSNSSNAASTTGMYAGRQPAIHATSATSRTVIGSERAANRPTGSSAGRGADRSIAPIPSVVGRIIGQPSVRSPSI
jgi:hypothetical protein